MKRENYEKRYYNKLKVSMSILKEERAVSTATIEQVAEKLIDFRIFDVVATDRRITGVIENELIVIFWDSLNVRKRKIYD